MRKQVLLLFVALIAINVQGNAIKDPRDLLDEIDKELSDLENTVKGQILVSHRKLGDAEIAFLTNSNNIVTNSEIQIQQEFQTVNEQLDVIKNLAQSAGKDISVCTTYNEPILRDLGQQYATRLRDCVTGINREEARIINRARYTVDTAINRVHSLEHRVALCSGNLLCLSPLVNDIQLEKVRLPQNIKTDTDSAITTITTLRISVDSCSVDNVADYTADASVILNTITACANAIIGH